MSKKWSCFLFVFIISCSIFFESKTSILIEKFKKIKEYLEKLREKEYAALKEVLTYLNTPQEKIEQYLEFYQDFKATYAQEVFVEKNPSSFHDPRLAEFSIGNSNFLEEIKKILKLCKINPESISIEYDENYNPSLEQQYKIFSRLPLFLLNFFNKIYLLFSLHADAYVTTKINEKLIKEDEKIYIDDFKEALAQGKLCFNLRITKRGTMLNNYSWFNHLVLHEISHLLEGDPFIHSVLPNQEINKKILENDQKFTKIWNNFVLRGEIIADIRMYLELGEKHLVHALRTHHTLLTKGARDQIHPSMYSTYKRLMKINKATWNIPFYKYIFFEQGTSVFKSIAVGIGLGLIPMIIIIKKLKK